MRIYLAHPFDSRLRMREWELVFEARTGIEIINPFYDIENRTDVQEIDLGRRERYDMDPATIVDRDVRNIAESDGIIAIVDGQLSYGTIMEVAYAHMLGLSPAIIVCTNGHEKHPWLRYHADVVTSLGEAERRLEAMR